MDWVEKILQKSCDRTLTKGEVLHSLFHMIEVNETTLNHIQTNKTDFGPEIEKLQRLFDEKCLKYKDDTNNGQNLQAQSDYDIIFKQLKT